MVVDGGQEELVLGHEHHTNGGLQSVRLGSYLISFGFLPHKQEGKQATNDIFERFFRFADLLYSKKSSSSNLIRGGSF